MRDKQAGSGEGVRGRQGATDERPHDGDAARARSLSFVGADSAMPVVQRKEAPAGDDGGATHSLGKFKTLVADVEVSSLKVLLDRKQMVTDLDAMSNEKDPPPRDILMEVLRTCAGLALSAVTAGFGGAIAGAATHALSAPKGKNTFPGPAKKNTIDKPDAPSRGDAMAQGAVGESVQQLMIGVVDLATSSVLDGLKGSKPATPEAAKHRFFSDQQLALNGAWEAQGHAFNKHKEGTFQRLFDAEPDKAIETLAAMKSAIMKGGPAARDKQRMETTAQYASFLAQSQLGRDWGRNVPLPMGGVERGGPAPGNKTSEPSQGTAMQTNMEIDRTGHGDLNSQRGAQRAADGVIDIHVVATDSAGDPTVKSAEIHGLNRSFVREIAEYTIAELKMPMRVHGMYHLPGYADYGYGILSRNEVGEDMMVGDNHALRQWLIRHGAKNGIPEKGSKGEKDAIARGFKKVLDRFSNMKLSRLGLRST